VLAGVAGFFSLICCEQENRADFSQCDKIIVSQTAFAARKRLIMPGIHIANSAVREDHATEVTYEYHSD
jgi:hypothetical protein